MLSNFFLKPAFSRPGFTFSVCMELLSLAEKFEAGRKLTKLSAQCLSATFGERSPSETFLRTKVKEWEASQRICWVGYKGG